MTAAWETWKKGFDAWEGSTAKLFESWLKSPLVLEPAGAALTATMKAKAARDKAIAQAWAALGLPTRRDQERILHALNQIQSRLIDLEERLEEASGPTSHTPRSPRTRSTPPSNRTRPTPPADRARQTPPSHREGAGGGHRVAKTADRTRSQKNGGSRATRSTLASDAEE